MIYSQLFILTVFSHRVALTGVFATASVSSLDGATLAPGGIDGNGVQVGKQFAESAGISYAFTVSLVFATFSNTSQGCTCTSVMKQKQSGWILTSSLMNKLVTGPFLNMLAGSHRMVRPISALVTPLPEEEKQDSNA